MISYVVGFAFSRDKKDIVLIEKQKPEWQKGLFNGIGGKIKIKDVHAGAAMVREFKEETGVEISVPWEHFCTLSGREYTLYCFKAFTNDIYQCKTIEAEKIQRMALDTALWFKPLVPSCQVLIRMALDEGFTFSKVEHNS